MRTSGLLVRNFLFLEIIIMYYCFYWVTLDAEGNRRNDDFSSVMVVPEFYRERRD